MTTSRVWVVLAAGAAMVAMAGCGADNPPPQTPYQTQPGYTTTQPGQAAQWQPGSTTPQQPGQAMQPETGQGTQQPTGMQPGETAQPGSGTQAPTDTTMAEPTQQPSGTTGVNESETALHARVHEALQQAPAVAEDGIRVTVEGAGVVRLEGTVDSEQEKQIAHDIAHGVQGVTVVYTNGLQVAP